MTEIDRHHELTVYGVECLDCKHVLGGNTCKAFPEQIPPEILTGKEHHHEVRPGQVGEYVFTPEEDNRQE